MDLSQLPDDILAIIFNYLPFKDRVRFARVNKTFQRLSDLVISRTKNFDGSSLANTKISVEQFRRLLNRTSGKVETIDLSSLDDQFVRLFLDFKYPRLFDLDVANSCTIDNEQLTTILKNVPNLTRFKFTANERLKFRGRRPFIKIQSLSVYGKNSTISFRALIGRFPNLRSFETSIQPSILALEKFFTTVPQLESLTLRYERNRIQYYRLERMYELKELRRLVLHDKCLKIPMADNSSLQRIARAFPLLEELSLRSVRIGEEGVRYLAVLKNLKFIHFAANHSSPHMDPGIRELIRCQDLRAILLPNSVVSPITLTTLVMSCPKLTSINVRSVQLASTNEAVQFLRTFVDTRKSEITIRCEFDKFTNFHDYGYWNKAEVMEELRKLDHDLGVCVRLDFRHFPPISCCEHECVYRIHI